MKQISYTITDPLGLHARPAGMLVKQAKLYKDAKITISKGEDTVDLKKLFMVMKLGVKKDDEIVLTVEGSDEENIAAELLDYIENNI